MSTVRRRGGASRGGAGGLARRMIAASVLLALIIGAAFAILLLAIGDLRGAERRSAHAQDVLVAANRLERLLLDLETGVRGFLLTKQERFLKPWRDARTAYPRRARSLLTLVGGEPAAERKAAEIAREGRAYIKRYSVPLIAAARAGEPVRPAAATVAGKRRVDALRVQFDELIAVERRADARSKRAADDAARRASAAAAAGLAGSIILISLYAAYLARAIVRPIRRAASMAGRLAGGDLSARMPETGAGEIGALERAFNVMGTSLERNRRELEDLAAGQGALRRVATLVARGAAPRDVFAAVAAEAGRLLGADITAVLRFEADGRATVVGGWSEGGTEIPIGASLALEGDGVAVEVKETGRPARANRFVGPVGSVSAWFGGAGARTGVGSPIVVEGVVWGAAAAVFVHDAPPVADSEARLSAFTELVATAIANAAAHAELTASRARIVATADETRRRIERDLHDGAQQRLVSLMLRLRAAQAAVPPDRDELVSELDGVAGELNAALDELREFARGIHPAILAEGGLGAALRTLGRRSAVPVELDIRTEERLPERVEVAAYYVVSEALANAAKHAQATSVAVDVEPVDGVLHVAVRDDGRGGAELRPGSGLFGLKDRVEALGGRISLDSPPGAGTSLRVELPATGIDPYEAEGVGFEPTVPGLPAQRFSRPPDSTTLAPLRERQTG